MSDLQGNTITAAQSVSTRTATITNTDPSVALQITQVGNASASTSAGGAVNIENTGSTGAGLVLYSNQASPAGRLLAVRVDNATFNQAAARIQSAGSGAALDVAASGTGAGGTFSAPGTAITNGHALVAQLTSTGGTLASAANFVSANTAASCVQVTGVETGRGSIKCAHVGDIGVADDQNGSALSLDLRTSSVAGGVQTNAQGIFIDATTGGTNGPLVDFRNAGNLILKVRHMSTAERSGAGLAFPVLQMGASAVMICTGTGSPLNIVTAPVGSLYLRTDGGANTTLYIKESGTGANTGWVAK